MTTVSAERAFSLDAGQRLDGFVVQRVTALPNLRATAYELTHERTGARILHLHAPQDAENLFCVTVPTPPPDDTGLPHILEHCVLGGSKKYPVKDPFFEMVKSSMATFINAMTADDFTVYPVASNVRQDFYNLAEVYWDAVFYPTLTEQTFRREAHHLEFASKGDTSSDLRIQGIVYNEMKGGMSGPDARLGELIDRHLFPDTPLGFNAGGEPDHIPDLRYEDFVRFHRTLYHPSNAYIFLYGDVPTSEHLAFLGPKLDAFSPQPASSPTPMQPRFTAPRSVRASYPLAAGQPTAERSFVLLAWIVGDAADVMDMLALAALERILLGNQGAPLRKALIDSKLGADLTHSHLGVWTRDVSFSVGLKGTEADRAEAIEKVIFQALTRLAEEGVPRENVDAAFQQLAYSHREINPQYPLNLLWRAQLAWLRAGDPIVGLRSDRLLDELRERYGRDPQLFSRLIRERLLDNPHRVTITLVPDSQMQAQQEATFTERMRALKASMSLEQLAEVARQEAELEQILNTPNSPEALATLPQLKVADLPRKPRHIPTTLEPVGPINVLRNDVFANGVNYLHMSFDLAALPEALWPYVPLFADCVSKMGAAGQDYAATAARIASNTGGVGFGADATGRVDDPGASARFGTFTTKFLDERADEALRLIEDLVFSLDLATHDRLREILLQARAYHRTRPAQAGMSIAMWRAARRFGPTRRLADEMYGVPMTRRIEQLATGDGVDELASRLREVQAILLASSRPTISFTGSPAVYDALIKRLGGWSGRLLTAPAASTALSEAQTDGPRREGFAAPMDAAYCVATLPAPHLTDPAAPLVMVGNRVLGSNYVLEEVRFKGTAYGGGSSYSGHNRVLSFHSYRDPHVLRTLDVFRKSIDWVRRAEWTRTDVDRAIITTAKDGERPIRPGEATGLALTRHLLGDTPERREARHAAVLSATPNATRQAMIDLLERGMSEASVCVVSNRDKLEGANRQRPDEALAIEDILPA